MKKPLRNYAFIDSQNLHLGVQELGWQLDYRRFRTYLQKKYGVDKAYLFFGYLKNEEGMYHAFKSYGYELIFKPVIQSHHHDVKGNIDAELVLQAMIDYQEYDGAVIITGDGDFHCLVKYLKMQGKLLRLLVPNRRKCSVLLRGKMIPNVPISFMDDLRQRLEYKK